MLDIAIKSTLSLAVLSSSLSVPSYDYTVYNTPQAPITEDSVIDEVWGEHSYIGKAIAHCESGIQQSKNGVIVRNPITPDVGTFQINVEYHGDMAKKMGLNIYTIEGNVKYAKYLFDKNGTRDWNASRHCWSKSIMET